MSLPDTQILEAVGTLLGQQLLIRDARLKALEDREGEPGRDGKDGIDGKDAEPAKDGINGVDGKDGTNGTDGKDGTDGTDGTNGKDGQDGAAGIGLDSPAWVAGVHREGVIVQHHIGQHFRAIRDTASEPPGPDWQRMGQGGFRLTGGYSEALEYLDGDLFVRDFGLFLQHKGEAHLWAGRGGKGEPGQRGGKGEDGKDGKAGQDGAVLQAVEVRGSTLVIVQRRPDSTLSDLSVDMMPFLEATAYALQDKFAAQIRQLREDCEDRISKALESPAVPRNGHQGRAGS